MELVRDRELLDNYGSFNEVIVILSWYRLVHERLEALSGLTVGERDNRLKLKVNLEKSAVARPWEPPATTQVARDSVKRFREKLKESFRKGRGRRLDRFIEGELNPMVRGWKNYFQLAEVEGTFEELDSWVRRKLRQMLWRQWKRSYTRAARLMARGLAKERAWKSAGNGHGSWWNSGASHMNEAFPREIL